MQGFLIRVVATFAVVVLTYNPLELSYFHWVRDDIVGGAGFQQQLALKALAGLALVVAYVVLIRATVSSIGAVGAVLVAALVAAVIWVLVDFNLISIADPGVLQWLVIIGVSIVLGVGLSWSLIRRRLSGQYDIVDEDTAE
jgi:hypothetical protein